VLVQVAGSSVNPVDAEIRAGHLQQVLPLAFPHTPGIDVAGTVADVGPDVTGIQFGDRVVGLLPMTDNGSAADFVLASAQVLAAAPTSIPLSDAAALPGTGLTAWQALFEHADLKAGQRILINGAGRAVGGFAVQLAKQEGAFVLATGSARSKDVVRAFGADQVIDHTMARVTDAVAEPVDAVLNVTALPPDQMSALLALVRQAGPSSRPPGPSRRTTDVVCVSYCWTPQRCGRARGTGRARRPR